MKSKILTLIACGTIILGLMSCDNSANITTPVQSSDTKALINGSAGQNATHTAGATEIFTYSITYRGQSEPNFLGATNFASDWAEVVVYFQNSVKPRSAKCYDTCGRTWTPTSGSITNNGITTRMYSCKEYIPTSCPGGEVWESWTW